jgi:4-amino-4-deoxy-L-arabinose transferase-like glycosyltransferase
MGKKKKAKKNRNILRIIGPFNIAVAAIVLAAAGQFLIFDSGTLAFGPSGTANFWPGLILLLIAAAVFLTAAQLSGAKEGSAPDKLDRRVEFAAFAAIMIIAIFYRVYMISDLPAGCYRDEGQNGNEAINIMNGTVIEGTSLPVYIERWTQNAAMYMYFIAASFKAFGIGVIQIRLVSIVLGILCVPGFYFFVRYLFGPRMAVIAGFLMAVTRWHVNFSRMGFLGILTVFFTILCVYFAYRCYKQRKLSDFVLLGAVTALSMYSYIAARLIPLGFLMFMAYLLFYDFGFYKKAWKKLLITLGVFMIVAGPLGIYAAQHPEQFMSRSSTVSIFNKVMLHEIGGRYVKKDGTTPREWYDLYIDNIQRTLLMFNYEGDGNPRHNFHTTPMLDFITGIMFVLGGFYALWRWRNPINFMMLALFAALLQAGLFSTESPQAYRTIAVIPVALYFVMAGVDALYRIINERFGKKAQSVLLAAAAACMIFIGYQNYEQYFVKYYNSAGSWAEFSTDEYNMGRYLKGLGGGWIGVVESAWVNSYTFQFASYPYRNYVEFSPSDWIPIKAKNEKNYVYILDDSYLPLLPVLKSMYPNGKYGDFRHKFYNDKILYFTYEVPYSDIVKQQSVVKKNGLTGYYYSDPISKMDRAAAVKLSNHWHGNPVITQLDHFILFNWTVDPIMGPFSVKWVGRVKIDSPGLYEFTTKSNDYSDLTIDGRMIIKNHGGGGGLNPESAKVLLSKGFHAVTLKYYESVQYAKMQFWWRMPGKIESEVVPSEVLFP